ncbi:hypothetical protein [Maricaulis sp. CAU 1757]
MATQEYRRLEKRLMSLKDDIPAVPSSRLNLTDSEKDQLATVAVFVHAAAEFFVEERCEGVVAKAQEYFDRNRHLKYCLRNLLVVRFAKTDDRKLERLEKICVGWGGGLRIRRSRLVGHDADLRAEIEGACNAYKQEIIRKNHGVTIKYLRKMLVPLGFSSDDLDPDMISAISDIARMRGAAAHTLGLHAVRIVHPSQMPGKIDRVAKGLRDLDSQLVGLLRRK